MWDTLIQSTDLKDYWDLIRLICHVKFIRMQYFPLKILCKLVIALLKRVKIVVKRENWAKVLIHRFNLALFYFIFIGFSNFIIIT